MAKLYKNKKNFLIIQLTLKEVVKVWGKYGDCGICDSCDQTPQKGYFVAALNQYLCPICFEKWFKSAESRPGDARFEQMQYDQAVHELTTAGLWEQ